MDVGLWWLQPGETTRYLAFDIGFYVSTKKKFEEVLQTLWKKTRVLIHHTHILSQPLFNNQSSFVIYTVVYCILMEPTSKIHIKNLYFSKEIHLIKERWHPTLPCQSSSLVSPKNCGGFNLIDLELQFKALLVKFSMKSLLPGPTPWRNLFIQRINALIPRKGRKWPPNSYYLLNAVKARGASLDFWWDLWKAGQESELPSNSSIHQHWMRYVVN